MNDMNQIVQVAVDAYRGNVTKYSVNDSMELLRTALIEANGGSTTMDYRRIRDGKCSEVFALVEQILSRTVYEGLQGDEFFMNMVESHNVALGDKNVFEIEDSNLFMVADAAEGTQGIRRQRFDGSHQVSLDTSFKAVRIYEELNRVLAGQVDFNKFIARVSESMKRKLLDDIFMLWNSASADQMGGAVSWRARTRPVTAPKCRRSGSSWTTQIPRRSAYSKRRPVIF